MKEWNGWTDHHKRLALHAEARNSALVMVAIGLLMGTLYAIGRITGWIN